MATNAPLSFYTVIEERDGALVCNCPSFRATGKSCMHVMVARMERDFGPVGNYLNVETVRNERGKKARGVIKNPVKPAAQRGRRFQARSDETVDKELYSFFERSEKDEGGHSSDVAEHSEPSEEDKEEKEEKQDVFSKEPIVSQGRPPAIIPLHPGRSHASKPSPSKPVLFKKKTGPKGRAHNSLLPALPKNATPSASEAKRPVNFSPRKLEHGPLFAEDVPKLPALEQMVSRCETCWLWTHIETMTFPWSQILAADDGYNSDELEMLDIDLKRWDRDHLMRQDEVVGLVDLLNAINSTIGGATLVFPDAYRAEAEKLRTLDWAPHDGPPTDASGQV
ncbi:hypothetical protein FPV67DRAFT_1434064 [Lyophyllum atratum]|nr:hypothetical protein FPV67DRAFT_1434064 [Lyophyllum atratum]